MNGLNALGVLRRQGRESGHAVYTQSCKGLQIGLDASAASAV